MNSTCSQLKVSTNISLFTQMHNVHLLRSAHHNEAQRLVSLADIAQLSKSLATFRRRIFNRAEEFFVPAIAHLVPESKQLSFNSKVLIKLGVFNSRLHLVSMHEAVTERGEDELQLFLKEIPSLALIMIPRWKRLLYDPLTRVLAPRK